MGEAAAASSTSLDLQHGVDLMLKKNLCGTVLHFLKLWSVYFHRCNRSEATWSTFMEYKERVCFLLHTNTVYKHLFMHRRRLSPLSRQETWLTKDACKEKMFKGCISFHNITFSPELWPPQTQIAVYLWCRPTVWLAWSMCGTYNIHFAFFNISKCAYCWGFTAMSKPFVWK